MTREILIAGRRYQVELNRANGGWDCVVRSAESSRNPYDTPSLDDAPVRRLQVDAVLTDTGVLSLLLEGKSYEVKRETLAGRRGVIIVIGGRRYPVELRDPRSLGGRHLVTAEADGPSKILAPMPGKIVRLLAAEGSVVEAGQGIVIIEAMKMQNELKSPKKGVLRKVYAAAGAAVIAGEEVALVE
jgi:biotin carboxyl carrier protein